MSPKSAQRSWACIHGSLRILEEAAIVGMGKIKQFRNLKGGLNRSPTSADKMLFQWWSDHALTPCRGELHPL